VCVGLLSTLSVDAIWAWNIERRRIPKVLRQFEIGSKNIHVGSNETYFERPKDESLVKHVVGQDAQPGFFNLVTGEHGTGKSTIVKYCCKEVGSGVLYILVPSNPNLFSDQLTKLINYDFQHVTFWSQVRSKYFGKEIRSPKSELDVVLSAISEASKLFDKKHRRPAVLVIDNLTVLAKKDPETFERLIRFAKEEADGRSLVVTFVSSEGHTPRNILELSESSRLANVIEIGDLDENDATTYLHKRGVVSQYEEVLHFTGGRISLLNQAIIEIRQNFKPEEIGKHFNTKISKEFSNNQLLLPADPSEVTNRQRKTWNELIAIHDSATKHVPWLEFGRNVGLLSNELLQENIFAYHTKDDTVSFQSKPVELYVNKIVGERDTTKRSEVNEILKNQKKE